MENRHRHVSGPVHTPVPLHLYFVILKLDLSFFYNYFRKFSRHFSWDLTNNFALDFARDFVGIIALNVFVNFSPLQKIKAFRKQFLKLFCDSPNTYLDYFIVAKTNNLKVISNIMVNIMSILQCMLPGSPLLVLSAAVRCLLIISVYGAILIMQGSLITMCVYKSIIGAFLGALRATSGSGWW